MKKIGKLGISLLIAIMLMVTTLPSASISANSENLIKNTGFTVQKDGSGNYNPTDWTVGYTSNRLLDGWYTDYNTNQWEEQFKPVETEAGLSLRVWMRENIRKAEARGNTMTQNLSGLEVGHMYSLTGTISSISTDVSGASYGSIEIHDASGNIVSSIRLDLKPNEAGTSITDTANFTYTGGTYKLVLRSYSYSGTMEQTINYTGLNLVPTVGENIVVKYVDENNTEISDTELISGFVGETYSTSEKTIENYTLIEVPSNATGTIKQEIQNVIYRYRLNDGAAVTVKYVDTDGNELASSEILTGQLTKPYTSQVKDIADYEVVTTPDNAEGVFTKDAQEVVYVYDLVQGAAVTVKYIDTEGNELATSDILTGQLTKPYTSQAQDIEDYEVVTTPDNAEGVFTKDAQEVVYVYDLVQGAAVTVKYVDTDGNELATSDILTGQLTKPYTSQVKDIADYEVVTTPDNAEGVFTKDAQEVVYVYDLVQGADVTVKYVDTEGNSISDDLIISGKLNSKYQTKAEVIENYTLVKLPDNENGIFTHNEQEVIYIYELGDAENVVVHYVDKNGTKLQESILLSGKLTTAYTTRALEIENYYLLSTPYNAKGTFSSSIQEVTYVYDLVQGENVTVKYVDTDGNELATSDILTGQLTKPYTSQAKEIRNYKLIKTPENAEGVFTEETQEVTYVYEKLPTETTPVLPNTGQGNQLMIGSTIVFLLGMGLVLISKKEKRQ